MHEHAQGLGFRGDIFEAIFYIIAVLSSQKIDSLLMVKR